MDHQEELGSNTLKKDHLVLIEWIMISNPMLILSIGQ